MWARTKFNRILPTLERGEDEIKWVRRCRTEGKIYMIGINHEATEKVMKKGRKIKNRLREFGQMTKEKIEEIKWGKDWNEEE